MIYVLEVVNTATDQVFEKIKVGVVSFERASTYEANVNKNLDHSKYHTRLIERWASEGEERSA